MKRFFTAIILTGFAIPTFAYVPPIVPEIINMGTIQGHDMQSIREKQFQVKEMYDMKEASVQKQRSGKEYPVSNQQRPVIQQMINNTNSEFVEENGQIKIKYMN